MTIEDVGVQFVAAGANVYIDQVGRAHDATTGLYVALGKGDKAAQGFEKGFGDVITGALRHVGEIMVDFTIKAGQAIGGFVKDSVSLAGDFESGMLNFQAVAGKEVDTKGLEEFRDLFIQLGKELPVSTSEVQLAATEMVKGGIDPATIAAGGLRQNIQFAAAAMDGDLVKAAEISSKVMGGWTAMTDSAADKSAFLTHATDLLAKAANASSTDVEGLSLGIFNAQGIAKTAGVSFDDLTTTLAELAPRFASSSEAGTSLKNLISRLQPTTKPAIAAMEGLGLITESGKNKFYDASGAFVGFQQASQLLQSSLQGLTKQQQASILQTIFGNDAMSAASALAELGASGYASMADALQNANGVLDAAALKQQGFNTSMENVKGSVEALQITIGTALLPVLDSLLNNYALPIVNTLIDLANAVLGDDDAFNKLSPTMQGVARAIEQIGPEVQQAADQVMGFVAVVRDLIDTFQSGKGQMAAFGGVVDDLSGIWQKALVIVQDVGNGYLAIAQSILPIVAQFWKDHGTEITAFFQTTYTKIMSIVNLALDLYEAVVPKVLNDVAAWIEAHATGIQAVLSGAWQAISAIIDGALTLIQGIFTIALDAINGDWTKAWADLQAMSATVVLDLEQAIEGFLNIIAGFFNTNLQKIADLWQHNWDMLVTYVSNIDWADVGANVIAGIVQGVTNNAGDLFNAIKHLASGALQAAKDALGISSPSTEFMSVGQNIMAGMIQGLLDGWPALTDQIGTIADSLVSQMESIGDRMQSAIASGFSATSTIDRQLVKNMQSLTSVSEGFYRTATENALKNAQQVASAYADPTIGAKFFKMRSDQIFEFQKLQQQIDSETDAAKKQQLQQQQTLITKAQEAEQAAFDAQYSRTGGAAADLVNQIHDLLASISNINQDTNFDTDQLSIVNALWDVFSQLSGAQHRAGGGAVNANQPYMVGEQGPELFFPKAAGRIMDNLASRQWQAMSAGSMAQMGNVTNTTHGATINMPIYTNQSPSVLQASMAIAGAALL